MSLADAVVSGNQTNGAGTGIYNAGNLTVNNSTISGNTIVNIPNEAAGIFNAGTTTLQVMDRVRGRTANLT